jgi:hypothetical protein
LNHILKVLKLLIYFYDIILDFKSRHPLYFLFKLLIFILYYELLRLYKLNDEDIKISQSYIQYHSLIKPFFIIITKNKKDKITTIKIDK